MSLRLHARTISLLGVCSLVYALAAQNANAVSASVTAVDKTGAPMGDVVVVFQPVGGAAITPTPPPDAKIAQRGMQFQPYVTVIQRGAKVSFPNEDKAEHHVKSFSEAKEFELKIYSSGPAPEVVFDKTGIVALHCTLHDWMRGYVYIVDTPWYSVTDGTGVARVPDLPPGKYKVAAWHPDMSTYFPPMEQTVDVGPSANDYKFSFTFTPKVRRNPTMS